MKRRQNLNRTELNLIIVRYSLYRIGTDLAGIKSNHFDRNLVLTPFNFNSYFVQNCFLLIIIKFAEDPTNPKNV